MQRYILRRLLQAIPLLILITFLSYSLLLLLPGDPVLALITGGDATLTEEAYEARRHELGLDRSIPVQYAMWMGRLFQGDFGRSTQTRRPVLDELRTRMPATLQIGAAALTFALVVAVPIGVASAIWRNSLVDRAVTLFAVGGVAVPDFWFAIMLILLFSERLGWFPAVGYANIIDRPRDALELMVMPVLVLGWGATALLARQTRSSMLEVLQQDYMRTARAKGLPQVQVIWVHALRNAMLPMVTILGLLVGRLFAGAVIVEQVFSIPGMGRFLVGSVFTRDFPVVQATVLIIAVSVIVANLITDILYAWLDPRIQYR